jgi:hyperosmotically inducible periplasmic protein
MNLDTRRFSRRSRWLVALVLVAAAGAGVLAFSDRAVVSDIGKTFSTVRDSSLDAALEAKVRSALALSRRASGLDIDVSVHSRIVALTGRVPTPEVRSIAEAIVADTPGVAGVENRLEVDPKAVANGYEASLLQRIADLETQVSVQERLRREPLLAGANVTVEVDQGIVLLRGAVESEMERETAQQVARSAVGAEQVRNELHALNPERGGGDVLARRVQFELYSTDAFDLSLLQVHSQAGRVRLEGSVRSEAERLLAARLAEGVPGVRDVVNELKPPETGM